MSARPIEIVKEIYAAFADENMDAISSALSEDVVWREAENYPYADRNPYRGPEAVLKGVFGRTAQDWEGFSTKMDTFIDGGDTVVALGRYHGVNRETGNKLDVQAAHVWTVKDGKVVQFQQYADTFGTAVAMGRCEG